ncbi:hypothetical protein GCM10009807_15290 [Microbacterium lacus]|uniref:Uncharacterized protein n=1 Tax=Microbacterium lacus TaxID=415217 RepID=A0ABP4SI30_9MICO
MVVAGSGAAEIGRDGRLTKRAHFAKRCDSLQRLHRPGGAFASETVEPVPATLLNIEESRVHQNAKVLAGGRGGHARHARKIARGYLTIAEECGRDQGTRGVTERTRGY